MPQLRQNIITGEWVVIAPERAKRPHDFITERPQNNQPTDDCPFCPHSPAYATRLAEADRPLTYVLPNKFPAFVAPLEHEIRSFPTEEGFYLAKPAIGGHELVVIRDHQQSLLHFDSPTLSALLCASQERYRHYRQNQEVEYVMAIYNHGEAAGASIGHPHGQIFASSIVPNHILKEKHGSEHYYEMHGRCVFCDVVRHESRQGTRVLAESSRFIAFTFFAARFPFEIWILPKNHQSMFEEASQEEIDELSELCREVFSSLDQTLHDPPLNFFIHSLPTTSEQADYYHWHLELAPRLTKYGGFELGSGTIIDVVSPEQAAEFLRQGEATNQSN